MGNYARFAHEVKRCGFQKTRYTAAYTANSCGISKVVIRNVQVVGVFGNKAGVIRAGVEWE